MSLPVQCCSLYVPVSSLTALLNSIVTHQSFCRSQIVAKATGSPYFARHFEYPRHAFSPQHHASANPLQQEHRHVTSVSDHWTPPDQPGYTGLSTLQYEYPRHTFSRQHSGSTHPLQQGHRQVSSATSHSVPPERPHNADLSTQPRPSHNEDGSWAPYDADYFYDMPTAAAEMPHPSHRVDAFQVFPTSPSSPNVNSSCHKWPQYVESQVESSLGYFSVLME